MATRAPTSSPEDRLADALTDANEEVGALSYRELKVLVAEEVGEARKVSHEQIRKYHEGLIGWRNVKVDVVKALARIYGKTLRQLSPELADIDEGKRPHLRPTQRKRSSTWSTASHMAQVA